MDTGIYRGDIFYINKAVVTGSEQEGGRPAIIVSNDKNNKYSECVEIVYLTTQPKADLPTHVTITSAPQTSTALCEQILTVSKDRIGSYIATITEKEENSINKALMVSLGIYSGKTENRAETEAEIYKQLYDDLLSKLLSGKDV